MKTSILRRIATTRRKNYQPRIHLNGKVTGDEPLQTKLGKKKKKKIGNAS